MNTLFVGKNFIELPEVGSTNAFANSLLASNPPEGTVVSALAQTAGRGQKDNLWLVEAGKNLTFSLILFPVFLPPTEVFALNKVLSLAIFRVLNSLLSKQEVKIKWPNDILIDGKKIAGILCENHLDSKGVRATIAGIGLNVNQTEFPLGLQDRASSLATCLGQSLDLKEVLEQLLGIIEGLYLQLRSGNTQRMDQDYLQNLYGYQEYIQMKIKGVEKKVLLVGVDKAGRLAVVIDERLQYFQMKEIEFCL